jgi:hypothetical protein
MGTVSSTSGFTFLLREMHKRGLRVYASYPDFAWKFQSRDEAATPQWHDAWESVADSLVPAMKEMHTFFQAGVTSAVGERDSRGFHKKGEHAWLFCNICECVQLVPRGVGAESARRKCSITPHCKGILRRFPDGIFEVTLRPPTHKKPKRLPGTPDGRGKHGYSEDIRHKAMSLVDEGNTITDAAKIMRETVPGAERLSIASISKWLTARREKDML